MNGPSLFRCPLCGSPLTQEERGCICPARHSFDRAAAGYVHLLPPNRMHSKAPGDDREMVAARAAFLERGYYAPLRQALEELVLEASAHLEGPVLLDSGCGEGYYTAGMFRALERAGHRPGQRGSISPNTPCAGPPSGFRRGNSQWPPPTACPWRTPRRTC